MGRLSWAWCLLATGVVAAGCCTPFTIQPVDAGPGCTTSFFGVSCDAGPRDAGHDAGHDVGVDAPTVTCVTPGLVGAQCPPSSQRCVSGSQCIDLGVPMTFQQAFGVSEGEVDPAHPGYAIVQTPQRPLEQAPLHAFPGGLCAQQCDTTVLDHCGACTSCTTTVTQLPIIATFGGVLTFLPVASRMFGDDTGLCRVDCTWSAASRGTGCPDDLYTCDAIANVCIEACTSDTECNTNVAYTYEGEIVTVLDTAHPRTCSAVTGRCEMAGRAGAAVGDHCASDADCAPGIGVCLAGGICAELGCPSPNTQTSTCASGRGVCLTTSTTSHPSSICLLGCDVAADCGPGNMCVALGSDIRIGTHAGYCIGACTADDECIPTETCTDATHAGGIGTVTIAFAHCVPRCTTPGGVGAGSGGCADAEVCLADHAGAVWGRCEPVDRFCGAPDTRSLPAVSTDCATGWVCDELLATLDGRHESIGDGHCTPGCTSDTDCAGRGACVTAGALAGLCRVSCTAPSDCVAPSVCDASLGLCVEAPPPL